MNTRLPVSSRAQFARRLLALAVPVVVAPFASAQFIQTGAGPYDYNDTANWSSGTINNQFVSTRNPTANQTVTFGVDTTLSGGLSINNTGSFSHTFLGLGADRTLTLGGNISLGSTGNANTNKVTIGSTTDGQRLNVDLGGSTRTLSVGTNRTLELINVFSGTGAIRQTGTGTLRLLNVANTYTGSTNFGDSGVVGGTIEVTKLANGGLGSSIGTSSNAATNLIFGGSTTAGTLRYIGSGDSTDRRFSVGSVGAQLDASGTGAINWTNTANVSWSGGGGTVRSVTLKGTNTGNNTMAAAFTNNGSGATSITKQDTGRWILSGNNSFTGPLTIEAGTLELGSNDAGGNGSALILNGGTFATGEFSESFASLDVNGNATIDFGSNSVASALVFGDSSGLGWGESVSLSIINFTEGWDSIRFGETADGLDILSQLGKITINGFAAEIDSLGFLSASAVPEPSAFAGLAGVAGLLAAATRRRRRA